MGDDSSTTRGFSNLIYQEVKNGNYSHVQEAVNPKIQTWIDSLAADGYEKTVRAEAIQLSSWQQLAYKTNHDSKKAP